MRKYNKKDPYYRVTVNCGKESDPVANIIKKKIKQGHNQSEIIREAILTMWSDNGEYKQRKILYYKRKLLRVHNDIKFLVEEREKIQKELEQMGATEEEIGEVFS